MNHHQGLERISPDDGSLQPKHYNVDFLLHYKMKKKQNKK